MIGRQLWRTALAATALAVAGPPVAAQTQQSATDDGATLTATVVVSHGIVDAKGTRVRELPSARYRLAQFADGRMKMTALADPAVTSGPLANRFTGVSVQANPETGRFEVRDANGTVIGLPAPPATALTDVPADPEALVATSAGRPSRRAAIERTFGRSVGRLRGYDRFLERSGNRVRELLVAPDTALPQEMNVVEGGVLVERHTFEYARTSRGGWVRRRASSESLVPGSSGQRLVAVTELDVTSAGGVR